jgi:phage baseplate assembly protein W
MQGMSASTGKPLAGEEHLRQSVRDILTTPIGSRVALRAYGSALPELIDQPMSPSLRQRLFGATATALLRWEPRLRLIGVALASAGAAGAFTLTVTVQRVDVLPAVRTTIDLPLTRSPALA